MVKIFVIVFSYIFIISSAPSFSQTKLFVQPTLSYYRYYQGNITSTSDTKGYLITSNKDLRLRATKGQAGFGFYGGIIFKEHIKLRLGYTTGTTGIAFWLRDNNGAEGEVPFVYIGQQIERRYSRIPVVSDFVVKKFNYLNAELIFSIGGVFDLYGKSDSEVIHLRTSELNDTLTYSGKTQTRNTHFTFTSILSYLQKNKKDKPILQLGLHFDYGLFQFIEANIDYSVNGTQYNAEISERGKAFYISLSLPLVIYNCSNVKDL